MENAFYLQIPFVVILINPLNIQVRLASLFPQYKTLMSRMDKYQPVKTWKMTVTKSGLFSAHFPFEETPMSSKIIYDNLTNVLKSLRYNFTLNIPVT